MANRYWVPGGNGLFWSGVLGTGVGTDGNNWSTVSGGVAGASTPSYGDNAIFDGNSGTGPITFKDTRVANIDFTGFNGSILLHNSGNAINIYDSYLKLSSGMTISSVYPSSPGYICLRANCAFYTQGISIGGGVLAYGSNLTIFGNLNITGVLLHQHGIFDANNYNVTAAGYYAYVPTVSYACTLSMGSGTWTITGYDGQFYDKVWKVQGTFLTLNSQTSNLIFNNSSSSPKSLGNGNMGYSFNQVLFTGSGTGDFYIYKSNSFNKLTVDTPPHTIHFERLTTQTIGILDINGTSSQMMKLEGSVSGNTWFISVPSGIVNCHYVSIRDSSAIGGATFNAIDSINVSNNSGWNFLVAVPVDISIFDSISVGENISVDNYKTMYCDILSSLNISEYINISTSDLNINVNDSLEINDFLNVGIKISQSDSLSINEYVLVRLDLEVNVSDTISTDERVYFGNILYVIINDNISIYSFNQTESFFFSPTPGGSKPKGKIRQLKPVAQKQRCL